MDLQYEAFLGRLGRIFYYVDIYYPYACIQIITSEPDHVKVDILKRYYQSFSLIDCISPSLPQNSITMRKVRLILSFLSRRMLYSHISSQATCSSPSCIRSSVLVSSIQTARCGSGYSIIMSEYRSIV